MGGILVVMLAVVIGLGSGRDPQKRSFANKPPTGNGAKRDSSMRHEAAGGGKGTEGDRRIAQPVIAGAHRQPLQFRAKPVEPAAVLTVLASGKQTVDERVGQLRAMRGIVLSEDERAAAMAFLSGKNVPEAMGKGSMHWLADELLTVLRLQEPPWDGLAAELGKIAFQPGTDPVLRDYIMQHLGIFPNRRSHSSYSSHLIESERAG